MPNIPDRTRTLAAVEAELVALRVEIDREIAGGRVVNQTIEDLEAHRQSIIAHLATVEDCIRDETQLLKILKELNLALALDELDGLDDLADELDEEEGDDESI